ncbi:MAG TPA: hypothetical protein EYH53_00540 [Methanothermococcus okinawensis]|nr:hypothetical protein [Methanothermococcus okinawensis]
MRPVTKGNIKYIVDEDIPIQQYFCSLLLSALAELIEDSQLFIDSIMEVIGPNLYVILKAKGLIKENYSDFGDFIRDINNAMNICDSVNVVSNGASLVVYLYRGCGHCKYCPVDIGGADLKSTGCPFPVLFEVIGKEAGFEYKTTDIKREKGACKIYYKKVKKNEKGINPIGYK